MNIQLSITNTISSEILIFHYQLCQKSLDYAVGFISQTHWDEEIKSLNEEQIKEIGTLWTSIKTKNRKKPNFYSLNTKNIGGTEITAFEPVKITEDGFYCPSLVLNAHEIYMISENPILEQIENLNSVSKIFKSKKKKNTVNQTPKTNPINKDTSTPTKRQSSASSGGYAALKSSFVSGIKPKQTKTQPQEAKTFNIWEDGVSKMISHGKTNQSSRGFIAKNIKTFNENIVKNALEALPKPEEKSIMDIYGYLLQIMREEERKQGKAQKARDKRSGLVL